MILRKHLIDTKINFLILFFRVILLLSIHTACSDPNSLPFPPLQFPNVLQGQVYNLSHPGPIPIDWVPPPYEAICTVIIQDVDQGIILELNTDNKGKFRAIVQDGIYYLRVKESFISSVTGPYQVQNGENLEVKAYFDNGMR